MRRHSTSNKDSAPACPKGKYWIRPHQRKRTDKNGKVYIEKVKGYCCSCHSPYQKIADEEKISLDQLYFALTLYGEARGENDASKRAIAWIIQNRFSKKWVETPIRQLYSGKVSFPAGKKVTPITRN